MKTKKSLIRKCLKCENINEHYKRSYYCKICTLTYNRERYKNPEVRKKSIERNLKRREEDLSYVQKSRINSRKFYNSLEGRARTLLKGIERRSKLRNEIHSVTLNHVIQGIQRGFCPKTGLPFWLDENKQRKNPYAPSVDRIDCTKPYSNDNVRVVIWAYNMGKAQMTDQEFYLLCKSVVRQYEQDCL